MTNIDQTVDSSIDWFAHAQEKRRVFKLKTEQAARDMARKKAAALSPPPVEKPSEPVKQLTPVRAPTDIRPLWRIIAQEVCRKHNVDLKDLLGRRRFKKFSLARREIFWRLRHERKMSLLDIGQKMGKDHTSVLHGLQVYARQNQPKVGE